MKLIDLLRDVVYIDESYLDQNIDIKDIKIDDKKIEEGDLFIALKGVNSNGNDYIDNALQRGAALVISDEKSGEKILKVENARSAYAKICKNFFCRCCDDLKIIAVTGTNGKTTIVNITGELLKFSGEKVGIIGTLGAKIGDEVIDTGLTTPDPYMLHSIFKSMKEKGCDYVVMEASAHALSLNKLDGIKFDIGVLTNITEDHLDFFENMDSYAAAKFKLFEKGRCKSALICKDALYGQLLLTECKIPTFSYSIKEKADIEASQIVKSFGGSEFDCSFLGNIAHFKVNLAGEYNIENALATIGICSLLNVKNEEIVKGLASLNPVEGRFNIIKLKGANVVIDYAHTPDGLENVLKTAREIGKDNKLVAIFGCGGNRDKQKRPIMGRIASHLADYVILTSDNPRLEDPYQIINDIKAGVDKKCLVIENRSDAIKYALSHFNNGETIVIAGKGAEKYQDKGGVKYPYNDFDEVYKFCRENFSSDPYIEKN